MFKRVEIICWLKHVRVFDPYDWTNLRQHHLASVGFAGGAFDFQKLPLV